MVDARGPITGLTMDAMDEEVKLLKAKSDECVRLIEKHKALHNTTLGEYQELDKYAVRVSGMSSFNNHF